jgi:hypothetical protein
MLLMCKLLVAAAARMVCIAVLLHMLFGLDVMDVFCAPTVS